MSRDPWLVQPAPPPADMAEGAAQAGAPQRRVAAISLPGLAIERWQRLRAARGAAVVPGEVPLALIVQGPHGAQVHAVSTGAALAGVQAGGPLVLMRAVCPDLRIAAGDPAGDRAALARLAEWAAGWGEAPAVDGPDGLSAEVTDSAGRFGGEALMASGIAAALGRAGLAARVAVGPSRAGAWALARFAPAAGGAAAGPVIGDHDALLALPVEALRLSPRPLMLLRRLGLRRIADLAALPRESLARRFAGAAPADNPLTRLDALTGHAPDLPEGAAMFRAAVAPDPPLTDPGPWLAALLADLCAQMAAAGQGCLALRLDLHRADGPRHSLVLRLPAPSNDAQALLGLFGTRPAAVALRFDLDMMVLRTLSVAPLPVVPEVPTGLPAVRATEPARPSPGAGAVLRLIGVEAPLGLAGARLGIAGAQPVPPGDPMLPALGGARGAPAARDLASAAATATATLGADAAAARPAAGMRPTPDSGRRERASAAIPGASVTAPSDAEDVTLAGADAPRPASPRPAMHPCDTPRREVPRRDALQHDAPLHDAARRDALQHAAPRHDAGPSDTPPGAPHLRIVPPAPERPVHLLIPPERIEPVGVSPSALPGRFIWRGRLLRLTATMVPDGPGHGGLTHGGLGHGGLGHQRPGHGGRGDRGLGPEGQGHGGRAGDPARRAPPALRAYFKAEDHTGQRLWIFRQSEGPDEGAPAAWFLHGIFQPG